MAFPQYGSFYESVAYSLQSIFHRIHTCLNSFPYLICLLNFQQIHNRQCLHICKEERYKMNSSVYGSSLMVHARANDSQILPATSDAMFIYTILLHWVCYFVSLNAYAEFVTLLRLMPPTHFPILTGQNNVKLYLMLTHLPIMTDQNKSNSQYRKSTLKRLLIQPHAHLS